MAEVAIYLWRTGMERLILGLSLTVIGTALVSLLSRRLSARTGLPWLWQHVIMFLDGGVGVTYLITQKEVSQTARLSLVLLQIILTSCYLIARYRERAEIARYRGRYRAEKGRNQ